MAPQSYSHRGLLAVTVCDLQSAGESCWLFAKYGLKILPTMCADYAYLLIVTCSQRKRSAPGLLPALERYDGVHFQVIRKARREGYWPENLDALIVSAKYGLLELNTSIENYDVRMTSKQAAELRPLLVPALAERVKSMSYVEIFLNIGQMYHLALEDWDVGLSPETIVIYASGGIGQRARQMRDWLVEKTMDKP